MRLEKWMVVIFCIVSCGVISAQAVAGTKAVTAKPAPVVLVPVKDSHTYSKPESAKVSHIALDLAVDFEKRELNGTAILSVHRNPKAIGAPVVLDTEKLTIRKVEVAGANGKYSLAKFELGKADAILGAPLTVQLPAAGNDFKVKIGYTTSPDGSALQWLTPEQTVGKKLPYLFTQSEAIHGRSWIPMQDSPGVRVTYSARIHTPKGLVAVMSADGNPQSRTGAEAAKGLRTFNFRMTQAVPPYLIALAVGDIAFRPLGPRAGVYDEPSVVDRDAKELEDVEKMIRSTEKLYGPYRWGRYDVVILPPSFPYGGMENPKLTFASPTIIAGDKSLVSVISHELAHSWSGNLVTNATWSDFWLNEGFTTYIERRIIEAVYGRRMAQMQAALGRQVLARDVAKFDAKDQVLHVDLEGRDPDDGSTELPYEKGALFLRLLEEKAGRINFDKFLNSYFNHFAFHSITTQDFVNYLNANLPAAKDIPIKEWTNEPGVPAGAPEVTSNAFDKVEIQAKAWLSGGAQLSALSTKEWTTQEWLHFLNHLPQDIGVSKMSELDDEFHFTQSGNIEITEAWLLISIRNRYRAADAKLESTMLHVGRRKIIKPLYAELAKTPEGKMRALVIYALARASYHPILSKEVDQMLGYKASDQK